MDIIGFARNSTKLHDIVAEEEEEEEEELTVHLYDYVFVNSKPWEVFAIDHATQMVKETTHNVILHGAVDTIL